MCRARGRTYTSTSIGAVFYRRDKALCRGCSHPHGQVVLYSLDYLVVNVRCYVVTLSLGYCRIQILKVPCASESPISDATVQVVLNRFLATTVGANLSRVV
jgi:hypothetical protein